MTSKTKIIITIIVIVILAGIGYGYYSWKMKSGEADRPLFSPTSSSITTLAEEVTKYLNAGGEDVVARVSGEPQLYTIQPIASKDLAQMRTTSVLGVSFKTPLGPATENEATKKYEGVREVSYTNGNSILVTNNRNKIIDEIREMTNASSTDVFTPVLGAKVASNYDMLSFILHSTPSRVAQSKTIEEARARAQALVIKDLSAFGLQSKTYEISRPGIKAFMTQFIDQDGGAILEVFFDNGAWYSILMSQTDLPAMDAIIQTIKLQ